MSKLHYCLNGRSVTEQVVLYQKTRESDDYLPIQLYYDNYKDHWYAQLKDYLDRVTFDADFDYKLSVAVASFKESTASSLQKKKGYGKVGAFNGLFYKILSNWKSNVKTSSFRVKRRPAIQCPICGRFVSRITMEHLQHFKTISDLPKFVVWNGDIYETYATPRVYAVTWGEKTNAKWNALQSKDVKTFADDKRRVRWPWKLSNGEKGVLCPFTKKVVPTIDDRYIHSLPDKYSRYAEKTSWESFLENYPNAHIQSEIFDLQKPMSHGDDGEIQDHISVDYRIGNPVETLDFESIQVGDVPTIYENVFHIIEGCVSDGVDRNILKLMASGYTVDDVADTLELDKKDIRSRIRAVKSNDLEILLRETV